MKNKINIATILIIFLITVSFQGCSSLLSELWSSGVSVDINHFKSQEYYGENIRRILLVPFSFETNREKVVNEVTEAFFVEFQKSGKFDIVMPHELISLLQQENLWGKGLLRADTLIKVKKRFNVDAVLLGTITHYRPYEPPILGLKLGMFSTKTGHVVWSCDAIVDSSDASVIKLMKYYYKKNYQQKQSLYNWKIVMLSMKRYSKFVAHRIITTL